MPLKILRGSGVAPIQPLLNRTVAVIGLGNQGQAQALNLRDSGVRVVVGVRAGSASQERARSLGFESFSIADAAANADLVIIGLPDEAQPEVYRSQIAPALRPGSILGFLHGFNIRFGSIEPPEDAGVIMIAPKGPGHTLRSRFLEGTGIPCLFALHQDSPAGEAEPIALAWANGIGCARAGILFTTFKDETDADLFGEQAVLCGGMTQLILAAFHTLVEAGYPPELAYLECCHEVKQIADLVYERGLSGMMQAISNTAEFGAYQAGPIIVDDRTRQRMRDLLDRIRNGEFAKTFRGDYEQGFEWFKQQRQSLKSAPIEQAGQGIRALMPWLGEQGRGKPV